MTTITTTADWIAAEAAEVPSGLPGRLGGRQGRRLPRRPGHPQRDGHPGADRGQPVRPRRPQRLGRRHGVGAPRRRRSGGAPRGDHGGVPRGDRRRIGPRRTHGRRRVVSTADETGAMAGLAQLMDRRARLYTTEGKPAHGWSVCGPRPLLCGSRGGGRDRPAGGGGLAGGRDAEQAFEDACRAAARADTALGRPRVRPWRRSSGSPSTRCGMSSPPTTCRASAREHPRRTRPARGHRTGHRAAPGDRRRHRRHDRGRGPAPAAARRSVRRRPGGLAPAGVGVEHSECWHVVGPHSALGGAEWFADVIAIVRQWHGWPS